MKLEDKVICIIGLGYVGLPLAVAFSKKFNVLGFDINSHRVKELNNGIDSTNEVTTKELKEAVKLELISDKAQLKKADIFIITVPTPIDSNLMPDLVPVIKASELVSEYLESGDIVIYESTVYPGVTEDICVPILSQGSSLKYNVDFFVGYSPERINPGDKVNKLETITKVTSGSNELSANIVNDLYSRVIDAGTHLAPSIKVAEAAKVIENVQRDVNIALINELYQVFNKMDINVGEVVEAASTKWNFMKLMPGLVGGHCIGVDHYYLIHKSQSVGYLPDLIKKAREINNSMPAYVVGDFLSRLIKMKINPVDLKVLLIGFSFKPDCPDIRNTKVFDVYKELLNSGFIVEIFDPHVSKEDVLKEYGVNVHTTFDGIDRSFKSIAFLGTSHSDIEQYKNVFEYVYDFKA